MNYVNIKVNIYSKFAIVEISNSKNNALDTKTIIELVNCLKKLSKNETLSCIAIKGNNKFLINSVQNKSDNNLNENVIIKQIFHLPKEESHYQNLI